MKIILSFTLLCICASCTMFYFEEPQPSGIKSINEFPRKLQGTYISADDSTSLQISSFNILYQSQNVNPIKLQIGKDFILKEYKRDFYINLKDNDNDYWGLYLLSLKGRTLFLRYPSVNEDDIMGFQEITQIKSVHSKEKDINEYILKPTLKELRKLIKAGLYETVDTLYKK